MDDNTKTQDLVITRILQAPIGEVWEAWVEPEQVMQWWGPEGFTSPRAEIDFREGGVSLVCMRAPQELGGQDLYNTWTYTKIVPLEAIAFVTHFTDEHGNPIDPTSVGIPEGTPETVRTLVTFRELGERMTEIVVTEFDWPVGEPMEMSRLGMEQCLDKMEALLAHERQPS
jgi:uncharacterized protein YndB with AHSA1/START domain